MEVEGEAVVVLEEEELWAPTRSDEDTERTNIIITKKDKKRDFLFLFFGGEKRGSIFGLYYYI